MTLIELIIVVSIIAILATVVSLGWTPTFGIWQRLTLAAAPFREAQARALYGDTSYFVVIDAAQHELRVGHAGGRAVINVQTGQPWRLQLADELDLEIQTVTPPTDTLWFLRADGMQKDLTLIVAPVSAPGQRYRIAMNAPQCRIVYENVP